MITEFEVYPGFFTGFGFSWTVSCKATAPRPWSFRIEESQSGLGEFEPITPELINLFAYEEGSDVRRRYNKDRNLFFRVRMTDAAGKEWYSSVRTPLGELPLQEFLYAKEIMRKELLQMRNLAGVPIQVWRKIQEGVDCTNCLDPVTREPMDPNCHVCFGTRYLTGYHGPYYTFGTFSTTKIHKQHAQDGSGVDDDRQHQIRMIARPHVIRDDLIVDTTSDRRYTVEVIQEELELRRIPVIQVIGATELEQDSRLYAIGTNEDDTSAELLCTVNN